MEYILLDKIKINRPILFLCGPYYNKNNRSDRRRILQDKIYREYKNKFLPLVIDDFLTEDNIKDENISIQLMEEIFAAVSAQTYIFLDTMSTATELGIFVNRAFSNKIKVYIPRIDDIYNRGNVGYFVRDVVLKSHPELVETILYRPRIERIAIATDYILEHYSFVNDKLPDNIAKDILYDKIFQEDDEHIVSLIESSNMPQTPYEICFNSNNRTLSISTSVRLLFYITISIIHCKYDGLLQTKEKDFSKFNIQEIAEDVKEAYSNFVGSKKGINIREYDSIEINTTIKKSLMVLVCHITKFVHVYYLYSRFKNCFLMNDPIGKIISEIDVRIHPNELFNLSKCHEELIKKINDNQELYFESIKIRKGKKIREIIKYRDDKNGIEARKLHEYICKQITQKYSANKNSYAYQKNKSIKQCALRHIEGNGFIKYDIKKFFNSINIKKVEKAIVEIFDIDTRFVGQVQAIIQTCFWNGQLPLGLVLSPIISDIYMNNFDNKLEEEFKPLNLIYTRYADDILVSSKSEINAELYNIIDNMIKEQLAKLGLSINEGKKLKVNFDKQHSFIRYVGINIVKGKNGNYLSVGKTYIYDLAKNYIKYDQKRKDKDIADDEEVRQQLAEDIFYERMIIIGRIGFVHQIEGERGYRRLETRLRKYDPNINLGEI